MSIDLSKVKYWVDNYGKAGLPDQRALEEFVICETREFIMPLQGQLLQISQGRVDEDLLRQILGGNRKAIYGSYEEWAKLMLLWLVPLIKAS